MVEGYGIRRAQGGLNRRARVRAGPDGNTTHQITNVNVPDRLHSGHEVDGAAVESDVAAIGSNIRGFGAALEDSRAGRRRGGCCTHACERRHPRLQIAHEHVGNAIRVTRLESRLLRPTLLTNSIASSCGGGASSTRSVPGIGFPASRNWFPLPLRQTLLALNSS